jgi:putative endonuclease
LAEHRGGTHDGFTRQYRVNRLVYFETTSDVRTAITREKQIKSWRREKKRALVETHNAAWNDLSLGW